MKNNFNSLGTIISGFKGPELIIIGSRPEQGKTWLALTIAKYMACKNKFTAFISLELSKDTLFDRFYRINETSGPAFIPYPQFTVLDNPQMTYSELEQNIRDLCHDKDIQAVFIDYLGLIMVNDNSLTGRKKEHAILITKLKALAEELNLPVIVTLQLPRGKEASMETIQSVIPSAEAFQCIDKLFLIKEAETQKKTIEVYKRSQSADWTTEVIQWTLPAV